MTSPEVYGALFLAAPSLQSAFPESEIGYEMCSFRLVANNRYALQYASPELRADRDVVMAASVANDRYALVPASVEVRADRNTHLGEGYIFFKE